MNISEVRADIEKALGRSPSCTPRLAMIFSRCNSIAEIFLVFDEIIV